MYIACKKKKKRIQNIENIVFVSYLIVFIPKFSI